MLKHIFPSSFMKNLKILHAEDKCGIDQNGIRGLNLKKLYAHDNKGIYNVSFMKKLKYLDISGEKCGVDQNGLWQIFFQRKKI